jgi:hypothetical protein
MRRPGSISSSRRRGSWSWCRPDSGRPARSLSVGADSTQEALCIEATTVGRRVLVSSFAPDSSSIPGASSSPRLGHNSNERGLASGVARFGAAQLGQRTVGRSVRRGSRHRPTPSSFSVCVRAPSAVPPAPVVLPHASPSRRGSALWREVLSRHSSYAAAEYLGQPW